MKKPARFHRRYASNGDLLVTHTEPIDLVGLTATWTGGAGDVLVEVDGRAVVTRTGATSPLVIDSPWLGLYLPVGSALRVVTPAAGTVELAAFR